MDGFIKMILSIYNCMPKIKAPSHIGTKKYHKVSEAYHSHIGLIRTGVMLLKWPFTYVDLCQVSWLYLHMDYQKSVKYIIKLKLAE